MGLNFREYQLDARLTAVYPEEYAIVYPALGLAGEAGEVADKIKKLIRDDNLDIEAIALELGDVLWYVSNLAYDLRLNLEDIAEKNLIKLRGRMSEDKIHGSGDYR